MNSCSAVFLHFCISVFLHFSVSVFLFWRRVLFVCLPSAGWGGDKMRSLWKNDGAENFHSSSDGAWHINGPPRPFSYFSSVLLSYLRPNIKIENKQNQEISESWELLLFKKEWHGRALMFLAIPLPPSKLRTVLVILMLHCSFTTQRTYSSNITNKSPWISLCFWRPSFFCFIIFIVIDPSWLRIVLVILPELWGGWLLAINGCKAASYQPDKEMVTLFTYTVNQHKMCDVAEFSRRVQYLSALMYSALPAS